MIPTKATDNELSRYTANIVSAYRAAFPDEVERGKQWYSVAHDLALVLGDGDVRLGAGILAALSPQKPWKTNMELAHRAVHHGTPSGQVGDSLRKCEAIMTGADPEAVLPMDLKTGHFYRCIVDPSDPDPVCIDRHAHDIAVGQRYGIAERGLSNKTRYATLALAYRLAARELEEIPSVVQAVTWVRQVALYQYQRVTA